MPHCIVDVLSVFFSMIFDRHSLAILSPLASFSICQSWLSRRMYVDSVDLFYAKWSAFHPQRHRVQQVWSCRGTDVRTQDSLWNASGYLCLLRKKHDCPTAHWEWSLVRVCDEMTVTKWSFTGMVNVLAITYAQLLNWATHEGCMQDRPVCQAPRSSAIFLGASDSTILPRSFLWFRTEFRNINSLASKDTCIVLVFVH